MNETLSLLFIIGCVFLPMILNKPQEVVKYVYIETPSKPKKVEDNRIKKDAILALTSLGMKKSDAVEKANEMFSNKKYKSIEDFIVDAYKK